VRDFGNIVQRMTNDLWKWVVAVCEQSSLMYHGEHVRDSLHVRAEAQAWFSGCTCIYVVSDARSPRESRSR
jgi:hypothetical protein